jgi:hypothetical protein
MEPTLADLEDPFAGQLVEEIKVLAGRLGHHLWVIEEERAARGLGDPAVTGHGTGGHGHTPFAPEPVARGRKTRGTT